MTPGRRVRARRCPPAACALIGAIARRATSIATTTAACNAPHTITRAFARTHRQRPRSRQYSKHKPRTGRRAIARMRTLCGQRSRGQRASRRAHRRARRARAALAAPQAQIAPNRRDCSKRTPAGPPKGTQTPLWCRPQNGRGTGDGTWRQRLARPHRAGRPSSATRRTSPHVSRCRRARRAIEHCCT